MERATPVRKTHTSTADLLTWSETPPSDSPALNSASRSAFRSHQPSDGIRKVVFGGQVTDEETESLNKRKPCSEHKMKEITGSGIFVAKVEDEAQIANLTPNSKTGLRMYQQTIAGISHISFSEEDGVAPTKPATLTEVAKQRELSGNMESESEAAAMMQRQLSDAKCKELSGHDIFAPPPEIKPQPVTARTLELKGSIEIGETPNAAGEDGVMKTAKKIYNQKFAELSGNDIFKSDVPPSSAEKPLSVAKLREMNGSNIFADGKAESRPREYLGGVRKPPGGESSIALV